MLNAIMFKWYLYRMTAALNEYNLLVILQDDGHFVHSCDLKHYAKKYAKYAKKLYNLGFPPKVLFLRNDV